MRIWNINHHADPPEGQATRTFDLAVQLNQRGHTVTIFTSTFNHYHFRHVRRLGWRVWRHETIEGVDIIWIRTPPYRGNDWRRVLNNAVFAALALGAGSVERGRPDVVIGTSVHPLAALTGYALARLRHAVFVFEETDMWPRVLIDFGRLREDSKTALAMTRIEAMLYRKASRVVMLMRGAEDHVEAAGGDPRKVVWIPHGVDIRRYDGLKPYDGAPNRPFRVMYLGAFLTSNAIDSILDVAAELRNRGRDDIRFLFVGAGTRRSEVIDEARRRNLANVAFPDSVPKARIAEAMADADAFIYGLPDLPIYRYGITLNKMTDYMAGARPIIFFGNSSYDPVTEARAGYRVPPGNPNLVADAIEQLVSLEPEERAAMGLRARGWLMQHHEIGVLADRLEAELFAATAEAGAER